MSIGMSTRRQAPAAMEATNVEKKIGRSLIFVIETEGGREGQVSLI